MSWESIVGHARMKQFIRRSLVQNRLSHAYLFAGAKGIGKATVAFKLAQAALCDDLDDGVPCGICDNCVRCDRGFHPDLHVLTPDGESLRIDQVRGLRQNMSLKPYQAERKIAIIDEATAMTVQAQNALLKLLEEPPPGTVLIIIATNIGAILPTIRSRCQILRFQPLSKDEIADFIERRGETRAQSLLLAGLSEGSISEALHAMEGETFAWRDRVADWVESMLSRGKESVRALIVIGQELDDEREDADRFLNLLSLWLRDLLLVREGLDDQLTNTDATEKLKRQQATLVSADLAGALSAVDKARRRLRMRANYRLTVDAMLTQVKRSLSS